MPVNNNNNSDASEDHPDEPLLVGYTAALLMGAGTEPKWVSVIAHLVECPSCRDAAVRYATRIVEAPELRLLRPLGPALQAQRFWTERLTTHGHPAMREAAAQELGDIEPLGPEAVRALASAALEDGDADVRAAAARTFSTVGAHQSWSQTLEQRDLMELAKS